MSGAVRITDPAAAGPSADNRTRRAALRAAIALPPLLALPGCFEAAMDDLPPVPDGTRRYNENGVWETVHDQFGSGIRGALKYRYGDVQLTDYFLPRRFSWDDVVRHYDAALIDRGWRPDEAISGPLGRGHLRVWSGGWKRAWRGMITVAMLERPDPNGLGLGHSFFVAASQGW